MSAGDAGKASARGRRGGARGKARKPPPRGGGPAYYQQLHDTSAGYQENNWLLDDLAALRAIGGGSILEVGCGNGRFLARAAAHWSQVTGVDWVRSPVLDGVLAAHPGIRFVQEDVAAFGPDQRFDLLVSADFLEHLAPAALPAVLARMDGWADVGYHRIACYDDGHSHLSVLDARGWLRVFEEACPGAGYRIVRKAYRRPGRKRAVVVISNLPPSSPTPTSQEENATAAPA